MSAPRRQIALHPAAAQACAAPAPQRNALRCDDCGRYRSASAPAFALAIGLLVCSAPCGADADPRFETAIQVAELRTVKLHGGAIGREHGYGSGVLVSSDGQIVTTAAAMLETASLRCVLADGRRYPARIVARDDEHQLVLLKIDAERLPCFELGDSSRVLVGDWVIAAANPFKVAQGSEPVSFMAGILSGRTVLSARRRAQDFPYRGPILLLDMIVATPGSSGGAVVDLDGRLIGLVGRPVIGAQTNTWLNYALPVEIVAEFLRAASAGELAQPAQAPASRPAGPTPEDLGLRLFDVGGRTRPAYVERVRSGSPAALAGLRANDLVLSVGGRATATCADLRDAVAALPPGSTVALVVKRGEQVLELSLTPPEPAQ